MNQMSCPIENTNQQSKEKEQTQSSFWEKYGELVAALTSGVLILIAWILSQFSISETVTVALYISAFVIGGFAKAKEGIEETIKNKEPNVELLMIFAAIGSGLIGYWAEGAILIFIFSLSGALETYTMNKSHKEIASLMNLQPQEALKITADGESIVPVESLQVGDLVLVKPGERIPTDGKINKGTSNLDEAAITGESIPVSKQVGDEVFTGTVNLRSSIVVEVTKKSSDSLFQKIIDLVQNAQSEKSPSQQFIERFEGKYVKVVLVAVLLMMFLPHYLLGWSWNDTIYRAMVLLVVASPCALVASIMPATLSAISNGAKRGVLFKGGVHIESLGHLNCIAFDKTGTLTKGKPEVTNIVVRPDLDTNTFLNIVASVEKHSTHPLAQAIVTYAEQQPNTSFIEIDHMEDVSGWGVKATVEKKEWKIGKKAFVGDEAAETFENGIAIQLAEEGKTTVFVQDEKGIAGVLALQDTIRQEAIDALALLHRYGIRTVMITGDSEKTAQAIAKEAGVDEYFAECLPQDKVTIIKQLKEKYETVAMVGDGINDAPALATATTGVAMGEGTDVALETADVVLMKNDLSKIAYAIKLSRKMNKIVKQNIIFSLTVIVLLISANFLQAVNLPLGVIGHEGSTILVILNGLRLLREQN